MKRNVTVGRFELLNWINNFTECEYQKIEHLGDSIGFCQVLDDIFPMHINLSHQIFKPDKRDDYIENCIVLNNQLEDIGLQKPVDIKKQANLKFQDNFHFLQWLYNQANNQENFDKNRGINGFEMRCKAKRVKPDSVMLERHFTTHQIPNNIAIGLKKGMKAKQKSENIPTDKNGLGNIPNRQNISINVNTEPVDPNDEDLEVVELVVNKMQEQLMQKMEFNWRIIHAIGETMTERDFFYDMLCDIESVCNDCHSENSTIKLKAKEILSSKPRDLMAYEQDESGYEQYLQNGEDSDVIESDGLIIKMNSDNTIGKENEAQDKPSSKLQSKRRTLKLNEQKNEIGNKKQGGLISEKIDNKYGYQRHIGDLNSKNDPLKTISSQDTKSNRIFGNDELTDNRNQITQPETYYRELNQYGQGEIDGDGPYYTESPDRQPNDVSEVIDLRTDESYEQSTSKKNIDKFNLQNKDTQKQKDGTIPTDAYYENIVDNQHDKQINTEQDEFFDYDNNINDMMSKILSEGLKGSYHDQKNQKGSYKNDVDIETSINKVNELMPGSTGSSFNQEQKQKSNPKKTRYKKPVAIGEYKSDRTTKFKSQNQNVKGSVASKISLSNSQNAIPNVNSENKHGSFKKLD